MTAPQATFQIGLIIVCLLVGYAMAQPQPTIDDVNPDWCRLDFDNGSQWYVKNESIVAIWAIPKPESDKLGYKTRIYGTGFTINAPMTVKEIERRIVRAKQATLIKFLEDVE